jgi:hypothetical protein
LTDEEWKRYYQSLSEGFNAVGFSYDHQHYQDYMQTAESAGKLQVLIVSYKIMMFFIMKYVHDHNDVPLMNFDNEIFSFKPI